VLLAACKPPEQSAVVSIVGAVLIDGTGGPPISNSVVTIENGHIRAAGARVNLMTPPEAQKVDGSGKFLAPALVDALHQDPGRRSYVIYHPGDPDGIVEAARRDRLPVFADISSLRDTTTILNFGVTVFLHMIRDTEAIDPAFIAQLRDLRAVFVPMLAAEHNQAVLAVAKHNTKRLADAGVLIAVGSAGDTQHEMELLVEAGLAPADVLVAATRNGAMALREIDWAGTLEPGKRADLLLLNANPAEDIRNLKKIDRVMQNGQWR
jgi:imidazolonepropionase-like amidohydrolase